MDSDAYLLQRMRKGDDLAIEAFVKKYYPIILSYCRKRIQDIHLSEDLTQETFERFFRNFSEYEHYGKMINYLYTIARNVCNDSYRTNTTELSMDEWNLNDSDWKAEYKGEPVCDSIHHLIEQIDMERAVNRLPKIYREVIILYYFCELKQAEIAAVLNVKVRIVKYRIKRGKELLEKILKEETLYDRAGTDGSEYQGNY